MHPSHVQVVLSACTGRAVSHACPMLCIVTVTRFNHAFVMLLVIQQSRFGRVIPHILSVGCHCVSHAAITHSSTNPSRSIHALISSFASGVLFRASCCFLLNLYLFRYFNLLFLSLDVLKHSVLSSQYSTF